MEIILEQDSRGKIVVDSDIFARPFSEACPNADIAHEGKTFKDVLVSDLKTGLDKMGYARYKEKLILAGMITEAEVFGGI